MVFKNEMAVREWVRALPCQVEWTESARGATQGQADARLALSCGSIPLELKCWDMLQAGLFAARIRPMQIVYHYKAARAGVRTLVLWGCPTLHGIWVIPGRQAPRKAVSRIAPDQAKAWYDPGGGEMFLRDIISGKLWE